jgi:hypothetical protein
MTSQTHEAVRRILQEDIVPTADFLEQIAGAVPGEGAEAQPRSIAADFTAQSQEKRWSAELYPNSPFARFIAEVFVTKLTREVTAGAVHEVLAMSRSNLVIRALTLQSKPITDEDRQRILRFTDLDQLIRWFDRSFTVSSASELFNEG